MIPTKVYDIIINLLPMIILFSIVMILTRLVTMLYSKEKIIVYKELKNLLYIVYCFALFNLVTTTDFESFSNNFIPFKEIMRYKTTNLLFIRNVIGNIAIFIPFGYLITDMIKEKAGKCNIFIQTLIIFLTSLTIETIQMFIGRSFDIDDIILNVTGGVFGFLIYVLSHKIYERFPSKYQTNGFKLIMFFVSVLIIIGLFAISYEVIK